MDENIIGLVAVIGIFVIPGLALMGHFVVRPIIDSLVKLRLSADQARLPPAEFERLSGLEQRMERLEQAVDRIAETSAFDAQLRASRPQPALGTGAPGPGESADSDPNR